MNDPTSFAVGRVLAALWLGAALLIVPAMARAADIGVAPARPLTACLDPDPPPWSYWVRDAQGRKTQQLAGFSIDLMRAVFGRIGRNIVFDGGMPWARCLNAVEQGDVDFAMDGYYSSDRAQHFAFSISYSTLTPQVFYSWQRPITINSAEDLSRYRGCGLIGANYSHYRLPPRALELGVNQYSKLIEKLLGGRCDYFVEELEVMAGFKALGDNYLDDPRVVHGPVPGAQAPSKHLLTRLGGPGAALLPALNAELAASIKDGEAQTIWRRHAAGLAYRP